MLSGPAVEGKKSLGLHCCGSPGSALEGISEQALRCERPRATLKNCTWRIVFGEPAVVLFSEKRCELLEIPGTPPKLCLFWRFQRKALGVYCFHSRNSDLLGQFRCKIKYFPFHLFSPGPLRVASSGTVTVNNTNWQVEAE